MDQKIARADYEGTIIAACIEPAKSSIVGIRFSLKQI